MPSSPDWETFVDGPNERIVAREKSAKKARRLRVFVWMTVILFPLLLLLLLVGNRNAVPRADTVLAPEGRAAAELAVSELADATLVGDFEVVYVGASDLTDITPNNPNAPARSVMQLRFVVATVDGVDFESSVPVVVDSRGGFSLAGRPSLVPLEPIFGDDWDDFDGWAGLTPISQVAGDVVDAVERWSVAYGSGDGDELRVVVGDGNQSRRYIPLPGSVGSVRVVNGSLLPDGDEMLIRAVVEIDLGAGMVETDMDLLVVEASSAAPSVVAWGSAGEGLGLVEFGNAVSAFRESDGVLSTTTTTVAEVVDVVEETEPAATEPAPTVPATTEAPTTTAPPTAPDTTEPATPDTTEPAAEQPAAATEGEGQ